VANKAATQQNDDITVPVPVIIVGLVLVLGLAGFVALERQGRVRPPAPVLTDEARAYIRAGSLKLSDVEMKAHESYVKQSIVEITGRIGNEGSRALKLVEINCVFYDAYGQVVLRERVPIVSRKIGGLAPGEIKNFRLAFDNIPESWNQGLPQLVIAQIMFGE
jgi:hypothetical protein